MEIPPSLKLTIDGVRCQRGDRVLFEGFSLVISSGEIVVLNGPNGVGKSSLLRIIAGLLPAKNGSVQLSTGKEVFACVGEYTHFLAHQNALKSSLSVEENLNFWRDFTHAPGLSAAEAMEEMELPHLLKLPSGVLSAGQKRRLAFARLLVAKRPLWLLDEPTAALDHEADVLVGQLISRHVESGGLVVAATHLPLQLGLPEASILSLDLSAFPPKQVFYEEDMV